VSTLDVQYRNCTLPGHSQQDTIIFFVGAIFTFFCFYLILKYFG